MDTMSFDSPSDHIEKEFPGLYGSDTAAAVDEDHDKSTRKKEKKEKKDKKDKDKSKDKGYQMFEEDDDSNNLEDVKSPGKTKKSGKSFKFQKKDIFPKNKDKEGKKENKEKRKEDKDAKKLKFKDKKKAKHGLNTAAQMAAIADKPVFGVPLAQAVERNKCHDGVELPALVRECIDYIEEYGLSCEGIYRISGVKSKIQLLKDCYNKGLPAYLYEHEPNVVASLLKQYLRELPEPVLTTALMPKFEESATIRSEEKKVEAFTKLMDQLPICNRLLLAWMIVHMSHIIHLHRDNKIYSIRREEGRSIHETNRPTTDL